MMPRPLLLFMALGCGLIAGTARSQEATPASVLSLELNALEPGDQGCRITFVVTNGLEGELSKSAFEIALFDADGRIGRLAILDFGQLPEGKTKVRRFDLNGTQCDSIGRVLVNDATECSGPGIGPSSCIDRLETRSKAGVAFGS